MSIRRAGVLGAGPGWKQRRGREGKKGKPRIAQGLTICVFPGATPLRPSPPGYLIPLSRYCSSTFPGKDWAGLGQWGWAEQGGEGRERDRKQYQVERGRERGSKRGKGSKW